VPLPLIHTDRLTLRPWTEQDIDALYNIWTDAGVRRHLFDDIVISRERAAELVASHLKTVASHGIGFWALQIYPTNEMIGFCGFAFPEDSAEPELMYGLLPKHWGRGFATEAARAALDYIWTSTAFPRVCAGTDPPNSKSAGVLERLKMQSVGTLPGPSGQPLLCYELERRNSTCPNVNVSPSRVAVVSAGARASQANWQYLCCSAKAQLSVRL
jgi:RimJ/RimL family protein N-acetyltransferase